MKCHNILLQYHWITRTMSYPHYNRFKGLGEGGLSRSCGKPRLATTAAHAARGAARPWRGRLRHRAVRRGRRPLRRDPDAVRWLTGNSDRSRARRGGQQWPLLLSAAAGADMRTAWSSSQVADGSRSAHGEHALCTLCAWSRAGMLPHASLNVSLVLLWLPEMWLYATDARPSRRTT